MFKKKKDTFDTIIDDTIKEYNLIVNDMPTISMTLHVEKEIANDLLGNINVLINSISHTPKDFQTELETIKENHDYFNSLPELIKNKYETKTLDASILGLKALGAAGAFTSVFGSSSALWFATTFGTASTGVAISTLSGAAAESAALAWIGGGTIAAGGAGAAGGAAILTMMGPLGLCVGGGAIAVYTLINNSKKKRIHINKLEEIDKVRTNKLQLEKIREVLELQTVEINELRIKLTDIFRDSMKYYGREYDDLNDEDKKKLMLVVNIASSLSTLVKKSLESEE